MTTAQRYALVNFDHDGLLLDLVSGNLFQLNESAALVWTNSLEGASETTIAEKLAQRFALSLAVAREDVARALALDPDGPALDERDGPYLYERSPGGYLLSRDGVPLLQVEDDGSTIRSADREPAARRDWPMILQAIAPKLMALRGHFVLHASAVLLGRSIIAFSGRSGAGKTTTARAVAKAGAQLVGEDKLVLRRVEDRIEGVIDCERRIFEWATGAAPDLSAGRAARCDGLDAAAGGESRPIGALGFLDVARRSGSALDAAPLGRAQATRALFGNSFHGSDRPEVWRRHLEAAAGAAVGFPTFEITAPSGLAALESAAGELAARGSLRPR